MRKTKWHITQYFCKYIVLIISAGRLRTKLCNKRDYFNFLIINVSFISSNMGWISLSWAYCTDYAFLAGGVNANKNATEPVVPSGWVAIMTWLTITGYLCHKLPRICFVCRNHSQVLSYMVYHRICSNSTTTGDPCRTGNAYILRGTWIHLWFMLLDFFCVMFCRLLIVLMSFFIWSLYCLCFFEIRFLITTLLSSNYLNSLSFEIYIKHLIE